MQERPTLSLEAVIDELGYRVGETRPGFGVQQLHEGAPRPHVRVEGAGELGPITGNRTLEYALEITIGGEKLAKPHLQLPRLGVKVLAEDVADAVGHLCSVLGELCLKREQEPVDLIANRGRVDLTPCPIEGLEAHLESGDGLVVSRTEVGEPEQVGDGLRAAKMNLERKLGWQRGRRVAAVTSVGIGVRMRGGHGIDETPMTTRV